MKVRSILSCFASLALSPICIAQGAGASPSYAANVSAPLSVSQKTEVPGASLDPGSYTIRIADSLQDRVIIQVSNGSNKPAATFLGFPSPSLDTAGTSGAVPFNSPLKDKPALRGFLFPDGTKIEFVYPKNDAVALAKANGVKVMAVDTASEGKVSLPHLSQQDMAEVTLWLLTPTPVGPTGGKPGIQAAKYQAPAPAAPAATVADNGTPAAPAPTPQTATPAPAPVETAAAAPAPAPDASSYPTPAPPSRSARSASSAPVQTASNTDPNLGRRPKQLPHTASNEPLLWLCAFGFLGIAGSLGLRRRMVPARPRS